MRSRVAAAVTLLAVVGIAPACGGSGAPTPAATPGEPPTVEELRVATYQGLNGVSGPVTLDHGMWEDAASHVAVTFARDYRVVGDLDGHPPDEAVVILTVNSGASGVVSYFAVVTRRDGRLVNLATTPIGDRVELRHVRIEGRRLVADVVQAGPDDPMCCPGELTSRSWTLEGDTLREAPATGPTSRLTLDAIAGGPWLLRSWASDESAPAAPVPTLEWRDGALSGYAGCNNYNAAVTTGDLPGDISVGAVAATRKMCPDAEMAIEQRYLDQFQRIVKYGFLLGQLALTYRTDDGVEVMLFDRQ
ncbi:MAG: META domain-containing protein [Vicinamibacterales bacterium]